MIFLLSFVLAQRLALGLGIIGPELNLTLLLAKMRGELFLLLLQVAAVLLQAHLLFFEGGLLRRDGCCLYA